MDKNTLKTLPYMHTSIYTFTDVATRRDRSKNSENSVNPGKGLNLKTPNLETWKVVSRRFMFVGFGLPRHFKFHTPPIIYVDGKAPSVSRDG